MYQNIATKVLTGEVRLSYVNLITPRAAQQGGEPKYSVTLLIPKSDNATKMDIDNSIRAAYEEGVSKKWGGAHPQPKVIVHCCLNCRYRHRYHYLRFHHRCHCLYLQQRHRFYYRPLP